MYLDSTLAAYPQGSTIPDTGPLGGFFSAQEPPPDHTVNTPIRRGSVRRGLETSAWDGGLYGSSSSASFASSYREYLERLGFNPPPLSRRLSLRLSIPNSGSSDAMTTVPEHSIPELPRRWPLRGDDDQVIDLRSLLPDKNDADECKEVYRKIVQNYLPALNWHMLEKKWERAWE